MAEMPSAEQLLQDAVWLKRLATSLANDNDDADDLVQESWIALWRRQPDASRPIRPWLAKVVRDLAGMKRRSERRRAAREHITIDDAQTSAAPDELVEQMRLHRFLVDLVLELDEPYRSTVIARFVEGRTSASIAGSLGIPAGTVRKRLSEALSRLRAGLDAKSGDRTRWAPAVLAFAKGGMQVAKPTKLVLAVLAALLLIGAATLVMIVHRGSSDSTPPGSGVPAATSEPTRSGVASVATPAAHVVVAVTDAAGPVADAVVRCALTDGEVVVARTARDGTSSIDLAAGEWSIAASADGREPSAVTLTVVAGRDAHVALVLAVGGRTLAGVVTDASGGAIAGARIDAARLVADAKPGRAVAVAFTDSGGHYKLTAGGGQLVVAASHPEYAPQRRYVDLGPSGATASFALVPGGVIEGLVRDVQTKQPVAGAIVRARHDSSALELADAKERVATSDGDGKFRLAGLRPGAYELSAREGRRSTRASVRVGLGVAEQQTDIIVLVAAGPAIRGKVVDETGAAVAAVNVRAFKVGGEESNAISNDAGGFVLEGLMPSRWMLRGTNERYLAEGGTIVELKALDLDGIVVRVKRGLEVKGHVEPRETCEIVLAKDDAADPFAHRGAESVTTSDNGEFRFAPLAPNNATVRARCPNGDAGTLDVTVAADAPDLVVPVTPGGSIAGRVIDTAGAPIVGVTVTAEPTSKHQTTTIVNGAVTSGFKAITSTDGSFEIRGLDAASYRLSALDRGRPMKVTKAIKVALAPAQRATGVDIAVDRPAGKIYGTVSGPDGAALADAWVALHQTAEDMFESMKPDDGDTRLVSIQSDGGGELPPVLSDARGHFELTNVPHGKYQVIAEAQAGKLRGGADDVTPDAEITIQLAGVGSLRGTVHGSRGPSDLFMVQLAGPTFDSRSFTDGAFEFSRVDPGDYTIEVTSSDGTGKATAHVSAGDAASVEVALVANATVTGRLVDKSGKPVVGTTVAIIPDQPPGQLQIIMHDLPATTGADGRFQIEGEPGKKTLVVLGRPPTVKPGLPLEAGKTIDVGDVTLVEQW